MARQPGCLPTQIPDSSAINLVQVSDASGDLSWQPVISQAEGIASPSPGTFPGETMLIAPSAATSTVTASGGLTITNDTTSFNWGTQSIKCVTDGNGGSNFLTLTLGSPVDLSSAVLGLGIEIDSFTPYNDFQIRMASDGFVSGNYDFCKPLYTSLSQRWIEPGLWEYITINRGAPAGNMSAGQWAQTGTGLSSYASVNSIRFKFVDNGGGVPMTIRLGFLSYFTRPSTGIVSITFDDSRLSQYTVAKPALDASRMRATCYNISEVVQNAGTGVYGSYFNTAQMAQLQNDSHWEMGAHAYTDVLGVQAHTLGYDSLTASDGQADVLALKTWLRQQAALGIDSMALPHGTWSLNTNATANANAAVLQMMAQYFNTAATTYANTVESYPPANRLKLRRYVASSSDTAASIMAMVNAAVTNKWWLILAFHNLVASPSQSTDFSISEFQSLIPQIATSGASLKTVGEVWRQGASATGGSTTVTAADTSIVVGGTGSAPTIATGTLDVIAADHAPAADWSNNSHKITSLASGSAPTDAMAFGQIPASPVPSDLSFLWWTGDHSGAAAATTLGALGTAGTVYLHAFWLRSTQTLSSLSWYLATAGSVLTSGQCFAGIYSISGTTATLQATTPDQAANWGGATGFKTVSFSSPYSNAPAGRYYVAYMFNGTTGPAFKGSGNLVSLINGGLTGAALRCAVSASTGNTTALPGTISLTGSASGSSLPVWAAGA